MKKSQYLLFIIFLVSTFNLRAQVEMKNTLSFGVGYSLINTAVSAIRNNTNADIRATPTLSFNYDRRINDWFSLTGSFAFTRAKLSVKDFEFSVDTGYVSVDFDTKVTRSSFSLVPLVHYGNDKSGGKWDLYSGARLGLSIWRAKINSNVDTFGLEEFNNNYVQNNIEGVSGFFDTFINSVSGFTPIVQLQIIGFGCSYFPIENLSIGGEIFCLGSPYMFSSKVAYRF
ncbi:MAG: hypothetical protein KBA06_01070 [Saprospiraceae bacterium]|nr:hypothetical protein [Saprospiraceae bacterium]